MSPEPKVAGEAQEIRARLLQLFPRLARLGRGTYAVGGAVRDLLLGREPPDVDLVATDPAACARRIGPRAVVLGRGEQTVTRVAVDRKLYDIVGFSGSTLEEDLARRDLTINAIALELATGALVDPHRGRDDIVTRTVRMIRESNFDDDPLRMLRAVRLALQLEFAIEPATREAIRLRAEMIVQPAAERVHEELSAALSSADLRAALALLHETGLDLPLFGADVSLTAAAPVQVPAAAAFALIVADPASFGRRWRWSRQLRRDVAALQRLLAVAPRDLVVALYEAGSPAAICAPAMFRAAGRDAFASEAELLLRGGVLSTRPLLDGDEIAAVAGGILAGPRIGSMKAALIAAQLRGEVQTRDEALELVRRVSSSA